MIAVRLSPFLRSRYFVSRSAASFSYQRRIRRLFNDGINLQQQTIEIDPVEHIRRCSLNKEMDIWSAYKTISPRVKTLGDVLEEGRLCSNDGPCVGYIESSKDSNSLKWLSYSQVIGKSQTIGSYFWKQLHLKPSESKIAILSANRMEYLFTEQACYMYGFILISLYTTYDWPMVESILKRTETDVLVVDNLERIPSIPTYLKKVIVMDPIEEKSSDQVQSLASIMESKQIVDRPVIDPQSIATLILTSGTTGEPKLAMLSHENVLATGKGHLLRLDRMNVKKPITSRHCSFLPMAHIYERFILLQGLLRGTEFVFCPSPDQLINYLALVQPNQLSVVPRILNKVYDTVMTEVNKSPVKRFLVQQTLRERPSFLSHLIFRKLRQRFGNHARVMITGAAPITPDVMHFFRIALNIPIMEGYGQTESAGSGTSTHPIDMSYGTIGSPVPTIEIKLVDVPGTHYLSAKNQGEICLRGPTIFKGYYNDEAKTREAIDADGWLHTGDVGEWTSTGALKIIDRTKHLFKLNQGRYIAPERLEDVYIRSGWVAQIFVDGLSSEAAIVAIVVPDEEFLRKNYSPAMNGKTFEELCHDEELKKIIHDDLIRLGEKANLRTYEIPQRIHLHDQLFSPANGLLTVTLKTRRANARKEFQSIIPSLYR